MHEISLVQNLLQQLDALVVENKRKRVTKVTMEVGLLSGVVIDSFKFGFDILTAEDPLTKGAELELLVPPVVYSCSGCGYQISTTDERPRKCPECNESFFSHEGSEDLILLHVELE